MARIAGIDLPRNKRVCVALTYITGIGRHTAGKVLASADVDPNTRTDALSEDQVGRLRKVIENTYKVEGDIRREVAASIKRLMDLGTYRGLRHRKGLPVRGQRTSTNSRTRKGPRGAAITGKKKATKK
jgi:small subunit ribosomal protein S13